MPTLLAFIPHPDDEAYSFAGTIARATDAGWRCVVHCATSGERGKRHDGGPPGLLKVARAREAELRASCALVGADPPVCWGLPDGSLRTDPGEQRRISAVIRDMAPAAILSLGPDGAYGHPDHVALSRWVVEAWSEIPAPPPLLFAVFPPALFLPQYEKCRGMMGDPPSPAPDEIGALRPDFEVPIMAVAARKLAAVAAHRTQLPGGDAHALFPPGILAALLETEWFASAGPGEMPTIPGIQKSRLGFPGGFAASNQPAS